MSEITELFFSERYLTILTLIILVLILCVVLYLIACQRKDRQLNESILDLEDKNDEKSLPLEDEFNFSNDYNNDEDTAIISAEELEKAKENYKETYGQSAEEVISQYETEQEKKAIISYEELLKNASMLRETFKEPESKNNVNNIEINQIAGDIKKVNNYIEEELFLRALKDFRVNLR